MRNTFLLFLLALAFAGCKSQPESTQSPAHAPTISVDPATSGSISGTVAFEGPAIKLPPLDMTADPACPGQPQASDAIVINQGKMANVFIYVKEGLPSGKFPIPSQPAVLDQKGCRYVPHVLGVMAGQPLRITTSDMADHNVHAMPTTNAAWNESQKPKDPAITKTFNKPEMKIAMQCNQHPWMRAYVNVMAHPYYAVSAPDGRFEIANLPPGEYTLVAVHERFGEQSARVKVAPKQNAQAEFTFRPGE
jgi:plastocyanin